MSGHAEDSAYALLTDGTTIEIRPARPADFTAVRDMHAKISPDNLYLRFFSVSPIVAEQEARRVCREPGPDHAALLAVLDGEVVGCGTYEQAGAGSRSAEVAFTVADDLHRHGIGMLLLEHLVSLARGRGFRAFTAETLTENTAMLRVFADAGLPAQRSLVDGVYDITFPLPSDETDAALGTYRDTVAVRERSADVASMRPMLIPASVAVVGASRRPGSVGRTILRNIITGGFAGQVYAVNPHAAELDGIACLPSAAVLPDDVDLAVIAVPAPAVLGVAEECGRRGVKALVVLAAGLGGEARAELFGICRRHGMRMVGPASYGVANPSIGLDATFAARHPRAGTAGLALQSTGGTGFVLLEHLSRLGIGLSSLVSFGDKDDVSGTDMLQWWELDEQTKLALLYLESIGNPPKFARTARRVGRTMPVLTVDVGRSATGQRLAGARAAKAATPLVTRRALFEQAGIIAVADLGELLDAAALLAVQPVPAGDRVGVVSNTRGGVVLAADACADAGLQIADLTGDTQRALRELLGGFAEVAGPVDTTLLVTPGSFRRSLELVGADPGVDVVLALTATTAGGDLVPEVGAARLPVPIAAAVMDQLEVVRLLPAPDGESAAVPAYAYPMSAAVALGHAARYGIWRASPPGQVPDLDGLRQDRARELVAGFLAEPSRGGWLPQDAAVELFGCYGVPLADSIGVNTEDAAVAAAARFAGPVTLRADVPGLLRTSDAGDVLTGLHGPDAVRRGFGVLTKTFGGRLAGVIVQPLVADGVEVTISVLHEQVVGPLMMFGTGVAVVDGQADRGARLAPLTDADADDLIRSVQAPGLLGRGHDGPADLTALRDLLLRVSRMVEDLPQIAELELSPVMARPNGILAVDGRIRIRVAEPADALLRRLP
ncbi:MAG TPA: GNAT family N-acetyltransferase [Streptosporangiaceae bacterium]|nr:GNAT family N-acetyltransferase [Streptosporangiaceae bacterium]